MTWVDTSVPRIGGRKRSAKGEAACAVRGSSATARSIERALVSGKSASLAAGRMGLSTSEVGDLIAGYAEE